MKLLEKLKKLFARENRERIVNAGVQAVTAPATEARKRVLDFWAQAITTIIAVLAFGYSCSANRTAKKTAHLHVRPTIASVWQDASWPNSRTNHSYVELVNRGPIDVKAFSVVSLIYVFPAYAKTPQHGTNMYVLFGRDRKTGVSVFESELKVGASTKAPLLSVASTNYGPMVFAMYVTYRRETDMQVFSDSFYYLLDGLTVLGPQNFQKDPRYEEMMRQITAFKFTREPTFPFE